MKKTIGISQKKYEALKHAVLTASLTPDDGLETANSKELEAAQDLVERSFTKTEKAARGGCNQVVSRVLVSAGMLPIPGGTGSLLIPKLTHSGTNAHVAKPSFRLSRTLTFINLMSLFHLVVAASANLRMLRS